MHLKGDFFCVHFYVRLDDDVNRLTQTLYSVNIWPGGRGEIRLRALLPAVHLGSHVTEFPIP
jgi:hypothetical protein